MPESSSSGPFSGLATWFGGKLLGAIFRGNRTTNEAGIAAFRERTAVRLNPPKPPPAALLQQSLYGSGGFPQEQQPSRRKGPTKKKRRSLADLWRTMPQGLQDQVFSSYGDAIMGGAGGSSKRSAYHAPPIGSKSAQRGFVGRVASGPAAAARSIGQEAARNTEMNRRLDMVRVGEANLGRQITEAEFEAWDKQWSLDQRAEFDPKWGEELEPAVAPEPLEPIRVPKRTKYGDLAPVEVPHRERYTDLDPITIPQRARYGGSARSGSGNGDQRAGGSTGTAGRTGGSTLPGTGAPGRSGTSASALSLHIGPLSIPLEPLLRAATTRKPSQRSGTARASQPGGATSPQPQFEFAPSYVGPSSLADNCDCSGKRKKSKPRQPRSECREGRYTQTSKGVKYRPDRIVPCS